MTKMLTADLSGAALDWIVGKLEEQHDRLLTVFRREDYIGHPIERETEFDSGKYQWWCPSRIWAQGGPIIEREGIMLRAIRKPGHFMDGQWLAMYDGTNTGTMVQWVKRTDWPRHYLQGPTPLIAAMRCYVKSKLGDVVDIPDELCHVQ